MARRAAAMGLDAERTEDLVLVVDELIANSVRHGDGRATLRIWRQGGVLLCEVRDGGRIYQPLAGRIHPTPEAGNGWGLWLVNQLCDLVQLRSSPAGTVVRVHMRSG